MHFSVVGIQTWFPCTHWIYLIQQLLSISPPQSHKRNTQTGQVGAGLWTMVIVVNYHIFCTYVTPWPWRTFLFLYLVRSGCDLGELSSFLFFCLLGMVPNQRRLSFVISDWESYRQPVFFTSWPLFLCFVFCFSMVRVWVGGVVYVSLSMIIYFSVWPGMVLNQRQLSIVVPDWEPYLGSLFSIVFCGWLFPV